MKLKLEIKIKNENIIGDLSINNDDKLGWQLFCNTLQKQEIPSGIYDIQLSYTEKFGRKIPTFLVDSNEYVIHPQVYPELTEMLENEILVGEDEKLENSILIFEKLMCSFKKNTKKHSIEIIAM